MKTGFFLNKFKIATDLDTIRYITLEFISKIPQNNNNYHIAQTLHTGFLGSSPLYWVPDV